jgi:hypothetical protein
MAKRLARGRKPTGLQGEKISEDYVRPTIRLAPGTMAQLRAWSALTGKPVWRCVEEAVLGAVDRLPAAQRALVKRAAKEQG